jgi:methylated-DNA-[protein]-cysteine S-methyltransferase
LTEASRAVTVATFHLEVDMQQRTIEHRATRGRRALPEALRRFDAVMRTPFGAVGVRTEALGTEDQCIAEIQYLRGDVAEVQPKDWLAERACAQFARYFADASAPIELPLKPVGTRFQRRVWDRIASIPSGRMLSYGELARELRSGPRAVGQACGANYFPLAIPCHRVVATGGIGGFARHDDGFHLAIKRWLLAHEGIEF